VLEYGICTVPPVPIMTTTVNVFDSIYVCPNEWEDQEHDRYYRIYASKGCTTATRERRVSPN
jgi:hypothetical protein